MRNWRTGLAFVWIALAGLPAAVLASELLFTPQGWDAWRESARLLTLLRNTVLLAGGTVALSLPLGSLGGLVLYRSDLRGRFALRRLTVVAMFIPLPLTASAWQALLGAAGWGVMYTFPPGDRQSPDPLISTGWAHGLLTAVIIHSAAALPWVVWLTGQGFLWVERHIEEDALTHGGAWSAFWQATLPRALPAMALAGFWVGIQAASEITITDMCQVRTFAEEVYTQFARPDPGTGFSPEQSQARALATAMPAALLSAVAVSLVAWSWRHRLPPLDAAPPTDWPLLKLGRWRAAAAGWVYLLLLIAVGIPFMSLLWKVGHVPPHGSWSIVIAGRQLARAWQAQSRRITISLLESAATGIAVALFAVLTCWVLRPYLRARPLLLFALVLLWCLPGPVLGIGLKDTILALMNVEDGVTGERLHVLRAILYDGPSLVPVMWASGLRFLPVAMAMLWPVVGLLPQHLIESARSDGVTDAGMLRHVVLPLTLWPVLRAALIGTALCLGELSASKLVNTPGCQTFADEIFMQLHFGVGNHLAAMCLLLLAVVAVLGGLIGMVPGTRRIV
jgi:iron(III) transport system permease protein